MPLSTCARKKINNENLCPLRQAKYSSECFQCTIVLQLVRHPLPRNRLPKSLHGHMTLLPCNASSSGMSS